jgi:aminoacyl tRNA synthase complex-interacting multifunctional protein 1
LQTLDTQLVPRTYLVNNYLTAADVALYGALHPTLVRPSSPPSRSIALINQFFLPMLFRSRSCSRRSTSRTPP